MPATQAARRDWARRGASARLIEIEQERNSILRAFPELKRTGSAAVFGMPRKRRISALARKKMSEGMRKYWAKRKAQAKAQHRA